MDRKEKFADRMRQLRESKKMKQKDFAKFLDIAPASLSAYENARKSPTLEVGQQIAEKCRVSLDWLCGLSEGKNAEIKLDTYADIMNILFRLDEAIELYILNRWDYERNFPLEGFANHLLLVSGDFYSIAINSKHIQQYLKMWRKYKEMLASRIIDRDIYQACIEKLLRESMFEIDKNDILNEYYSCDKSSQEHEDSNRNELPSAQQKTPAQSNEQGSSAE